MATILLPVKDRPQFIQEYKLKAANLKQSYGEGLNLYQHIKVLNATYSINRVDSLEHTFEN